MSCGNIDLDQDILGSMVSTGQKQLAIQVLLDAKKDNPQLGTQVDAYISRI